MNTATMRQMMHRRWNIGAALAAVVLSAGTASPALAQLALTRPDDNPAALTREAFASPYGRAMVAEFVTVLKASADATCLRSKNIKPEQLAQRGEAFIGKWGANAMTVLASYINLPIYETKFAQSAGVGAAGEMKRLAANADVKQYIAIERPRRLAYLLDYVFENFSRYVLISRIKMGQISPLATGNEELLNKNPTEKVEADLEQFLKTNTSPQVRRYAELSEQSSAALAASLNTDQVRNSLGPGTLFRGIDKEFAALCVSSANNPR
jgi:hypothetical protein